MKILCIHKIYLEQFEELRISVLWEMVVLQQEPVAILYAVLNGLGHFPNLTFHPKVHNLDPSFHSNLFS